MHELAERMLDINRPRDPDRMDCDAAAIAREVVALVRAGARDRPLEIDTDGVEAAPALIPPDALKQVLLNVVQNAREATDDRGRIALNVTRRDGKVLIEIADDGPGIPEGVLPRVFDPFFTTKGSVQGVGLGLFVAEGIARRHGGRMSALNREGGGALFRIELRSAERDEGFSAGLPVEGRQREDPRE
jgi:signal transduction histidine kinase